MITRFNSQYHLNLATELTCRFFPLARLHSILTVLCVLTLLLMLCIRKALTVTIGQLGGSNSNTYTQKEFREAMKRAFHLCDHNCGPIHCACGLHVKSLE